MTEHNPPDDRDPQAEVDQLRNADLSGAMEDIAAVQAQAAVHAARAAVRQAAATERLVAATEAHAAATARLADTLDALDLSRLDTIVSGMTTIEALLSSMQDEP